MKSAQFLALLSHVLVASAATSWIVPGAVWYDTSGKKIDAHGGGIIQRGMMFYWIGQSAANETPQMYSSTDLLNWKNLGAQASITGLWRPKIAKPNGSFWIFGQQDRDSDSLSSSAITGPYQQRAKTLLPPHSYSYSDTGMFYDESSSTWYLLTSADHNIVQINAINSDGSLGALASSLTAGAYEAPGLFKAGGVYFLIVSGKTGWRSNPNKVFTASSIKGPWTGGSDIAPEAQNTYGSQNTFELTIAGSQATTYIYMGDAWDSKGGANSNYVWLPMSVNPGARTVTLQYHSMWKVDTVTGVVTTSGSNTPKKYKARDALVSRSLGRTSLKSDVEMVFSNISASASKHWTKLSYTIRDASAGSVHLSVNGREHVDVASLNSRAGYSNEVPVLLEFTQGSSNTISILIKGHERHNVDFEGLEIVYD